ncbi:MAG: 3-phosphoshikimate 1-carboxyvinyltransferase [Oscillospiraceae bacterium]|jgi:5-enolpyruvylshikimate-3-phosphate synthase|nr:3-phosphoshikimate 1-carboxyvinyltransferase [Oscillospiraceae bacterium]
MTVTIPNTPWRGTVAAPSSKSDLHRKLICAALFGADCDIAYAGALGQDILATIDCLRALGAQVSQEAGVLRCKAVDLKKAPSAVPTLDCRESGSTLRFLLPVAAALCPQFIITGSGRLPVRPIDTALEILHTHGCATDGDHLPLCVQGRLTGHEFFLPGDVSSQYLSGLLFALPLLGGGQITLTTPLQSAAYVAMTLDALAAFSIVYTVAGGTYSLPVVTEKDIKKSLWRFARGSWKVLTGGGDVLTGIGRLRRLKLARAAFYGAKGSRDLMEGGQQMLSSSKELADAGKAQFRKVHAAADVGLQLARQVKDDVKARKLDALLHPKLTGYDFENPTELQELHAEGDWSNSAFWLCAGAHPGANVTVTGLTQNSRQGDRAIVDILRRMGARVTEEGERITVVGGNLHAIDLDVAEIPDLVPPVAVLMAVAEGTSSIRNGARLRVKESDRLVAVAKIITELGGSVDEKLDGLIIHGTAGKLSPTSAPVLDSHNDHRIAMAAALAAAWCTQPVTVTDAAAVHKSYPDFWALQQSLCTDCAPKNLPSVL